MLQDDNIKEFNPQLLLTNDCCLLLNPSGSFLVFKGLAEKQYLVDLDELDKATILESEEKNPKEFINDKDLVYISKTDSENDKLKVFDVITNQFKILDLNTKYPTDATVSSDFSKLFYLGFDANNNLIFNDQKKNHSDPIFNYVEMAMHPKSKFVLLSKIDKKDSQNQKYDIYNIRTGLITKHKIDSIKSIWAKN